MELLGYRILYYGNFKWKPTHIFFFIFFGLFWYRVFLSVLGLLLCMATGIGCCIFPVTVRNFKNESPDTSQR